MSEVDGDLGRSLRERRLPRLSTDRHVRIEVRTALPPETLTAIARHAGAAVTSPVPLGAHVQVVRGDEHRTEFVVTSFGGRTDLMRFTFTATADPGGGSTGVALITAAHWVQRRFAGVPLERRALRGWAQFHQFAVVLDAAVRTADRDVAATLAVRRGRAEPLSAPCA